MMFHATRPIAAPARPARLRELKPGDVRIKQGSVFARAEQQMLHLARVYPIDRLLAVFRRNAGLDTRGAAAPGTWEDFGHPNEDAWGEHDYPGRENAQTANLLRGHYAGHFLSMLAMAAATQDDDTLRAKVTDMVAGLGEVQEALAATGRYSHPGFLAAYGEWQFSMLESYAPYGEIWAPYYTCHKIMAGLLDAYELVGNEQALEIVTSMAYWVHKRLAALTDEQRQRMWSLYIAGEFGGMNETLARLSLVAAEPLFLETAHFFDQHNLLEAGQSHTDILTDMHANQHLPQLVGYVRDYEVTGDERKLDAVVGLWQHIVPGRTYAHGGNGESELWGPPNSVAGDIGHRNAETCVSYNMLKIARLLFAHTLDARYLAYSENTVHNHILGSKRDVNSDVSPEVTYMFPVHAGAIREYDNVGTCCGGTGLENHVGYGNGVAFEGEEALWITRLAAVDIDWREGGMRLSLDTELPADGAVVLTVSEAHGEDERKLNVWVPTWAGAEVSACVGDQSYTAAPGSFIEITRTWAEGDTVRFELPLAVRMDPTIDDPTLASLAIGPTLLLAHSDTTTPLSFPFDSLRALDGSLRFDRSAAELASALRSEGTIEIGGIEFEACGSGREEKFHMYLRRADAEIGFAGVSSGVPNRVRADGATLLSALWSSGGFASRAELLARVRSEALASRSEGLLSRDEFVRVLEAASVADYGQSANAAADTLALESALAEFDAMIDIPPAVAIEVDAEAAASGWYTTAPVLSLRVFDLAGNDANADSATDAGSVALRAEVRIDDGEWATYTGPFVLEHEGVRSVVARVTDARGLEGRSAREFAIDTKAPEVSAKLKRLGASVEITLNASDGISGVERIQWEGPGTFWATFQEAFVRALSDEEQVIEFAATDRAGNEGRRSRIVLPRVND